MSSYTIPYVTTRTNQGERTVDIYSRLLTERVIYLGTDIDDGVANAVIAQLIHLEYESADQPINLYINSAGGSITATLAIYDAMQYIRPAVETTCVGQAGATAAMVSSLPSLGLFAVDQALAAGARQVDYVDRSGRRRGVATTLGADVGVDIDPGTQHLSYPVVIGATSDPALLREAVLCLTPGGHLSNAGMFFADTPLPLWEMYQRDVTISVGAVSVTPHVPAVLELLRQRRLRPELVISVHDAEHAPEVLLARDMKPVLVRPQLIGPAPA